MLKMTSGKGFTFALLVGAPMMKNVGHIFHSACQTHSHPFAGNFIPLLHYSESDEAQKRPFRHNPNREI